MQTHSEARPHRPGQFRCSYTGELFPYAYTSDGSGQRAAERELKKHQADYVEAAEARAGRKLTVRELLKGGSAVEDARPIREKIAEHVTVSPVTDPTRNVYRERVDALKAELATLPKHGYKVAEKRAALERRIAMTKPQAEKFDAALTAKQEREAVLSRPDVQTALADAQASLVLVQCRRDVPQEWVAGARERKAALETSGDHAAYWTATKAAEAKQAEAIEAKAAAIDAEAAKLKAEAKAVRRGEEPGAAT